MQQQTYTLDADASLDEAVATLATEAEAKPAQSRLLLVFEPNCDADRCRSLAAKIAKAAPDLPMAGMTTLGPITNDIKMPTKTVLTLLSFDSSDARVFSFDCHNMTPREAGLQFADELSKIEHVAGILFMSSSIDLHPTPFLEAASKDIPEVPIFGAQAGTLQFAVDQSSVMANGTVLDRGIVAVVFSGGDLRIQADYNLGFRPLGREFTVTESDAGGLVKSIDDLPASSVYERYLKVAPDDFFYENVCSFPLLAESSNLLVAHVPLDYTDDGALKFSMNIEQGTKVTLAYSKPEYLLHETLLNANVMTRFVPEALLLFACMNRRIFMGDESADREFTYYANANSNLCWTYGFGEVYKTWEGGGVLNSSLVAVGMREGKHSGPTPESFHDEALDKAEEKAHSSIPLSDRMITFLEATSADLRAMIDNLSFLAQRDTLTGLFNRRYMNDLLGYELSRLKENDSLVLLMYDIDHFKHINDTYGHDVGDEVLRALTARVEEAIRSNDVLSRWGGEEFLLLFTRANPNLAFDLAERVRRHVEERYFDQVGQVTISVGVTLGTSKDTIESLFKRVDEALYEAKNTGRNRVCMK